MIINFEMMLYIQLMENNFNCYSAEYTSGNKTNYYFFSKDHNNLLISMRIDKNKKEKLELIYQTYTV